MYVSSPNQTKNDRDLKFGTHISYEHIYFFRISDPESYEPKKFRVTRDSAYICDCLCFHFPSNYLFSGKYFFPPVLLTFEGPFFSLFLAVLSYSDVMEFSGWQTYLGYDSFGLECSYSDSMDLDIPSDAQRINIMKKLIDAGLENKLLMSHNIKTKHRLVSKKAAR